MEERELAGLALQMVNSNSVSVEHAEVAVEVKDWLRGLAQSKARLKDLSGCLEVDSSQDSVQAE